MTDVSTRIWEIAQRTLRIEIQALEQLSAVLNEDFCRAVQAIYAAKGRLIVTGIGKSAIVAQKIVATLNSTGTPALFMHAADAIHGDLGMMQPDDMALCISKSGETAEIKALAPLIKRRGNRLIGMVSQPDSYLGRQSEFVLVTPVPREADPNNLAPTASTTAQMALGDALAVALLELRGFSPQDFALFHPGGSLGKQLYLRMSDIYPHNEKPAVPLECSIRGVILEMTSKRLGATAVLDDQGLLAGIITDGDLRRMLERHVHLDHLRAQDVMSAHPITVLPDTMAAEAFDLMRQRSITQVIVAEQGHYLGMVHIHDLIREGLI